MRAPGGKNAAAKPRRREPPRNREIATASAERRALASVTSFARRCKSWYTKKELDSLFSRRTPEISSRLISRSRVGHASVTCRSRVGQRTCWQKLRKLKELESRRRNEKHCNVRARTSEEEIDKRIHHKQSSGISSPKISRNDLRRKNLLLNSTKIAQKCFEAFNFVDFQNAVSIFFCDFWESDDKTYSPRLFLDVRDGFLPRERRESERRESESVKFSNFRRPFEKFRRKKMSQLPPGGPKRGTVSRPAKLFRDLSEFERFATE